MTVAINTRFICFWPKGYSATAVPSMCRVSMSLMHLNAHWKYKRVYKSFEKVTFCILVIRCTRDLNDVGS